MEERFWMKNQLRQKMFNAYCRHFGHVMKETRVDQLQCRLCGRVYYRVPGEGE